jgi:hypothetical protein
MLPFLFDIGVQTALFFDHVPRDERMFANVSAGVMDNTPQSFAAISPALPQIYAP